MTAKIFNFPIKEISKLENCVSCGERTKVRKDEPVNLRSNYLEGAGQFCGPCYRGNIIKTNEFAEALDKGRY